MQQEGEIKTLYNESFYDAQAELSYQSATFMLGFLHKILPNLSSVIDIGCGVGTWLRAWRDLNPKLKIVGVDGNAVDEKYYHIPLSSYLQTNLTQPYKQTIEQIQLYFAPPPPQY